MKSTEPVADRILRVAKELFASKGYEQTRTSEVARLAGTSESQLIKYFGGKQGLLSAIFDHGWAAIITSAEAELAAPRSAPEKLRTIARMVVGAFEKDRTWAALVLLEGRRLRGESADLILTRKFLQFVSLIDDVVVEMKKAGLLRPGVHHQLVRSSMMGMMEGLIRDRLLAERIGYPAHYRNADVFVALDALLKCFVISRKRRSTKATPA